MINGKDLIEYIIDHFGKVNAKQLQKIAYLTELEFMKKHGERLSNRDKLLGRGRILQGHWNQA